MTEFLMRDLLAATEMDIFEAIRKWAQGAKGSAGSVKDGAMVSTCVRLHKMPTEQLLNVVRPSGVVPDSILLDAFQKKHEMDVAGCEEYRLLQWKGVSISSAASLSDAPSKFDFSFSLSN
jgi:hypothetical protein